MGCGASALVNPDSPPPGPKPKPLELRVQWSTMSESDRRIAQATQASAAPPPPDDAPASAPSDASEPSSITAPAAKDPAASSAAATAASLAHRMLPTLTPLAERYDFGAVLGVGGFGEVRRVTRRADGKQLAVKTISKTKFRGDAERDNMVNEVQLMHRVRGHRNVVELVEWSEDLARFYLVVELCTGGELMARIAEADHFSERVAARYFRQMAEGLQWCHERLVVHRDVKPENFLFDVRGAAGVVKVTDFGLSAAIDSADAVLDEACGSAYYIAPEVFRRAYTKEADVFSLGVNLFLMLSGTVPFGADASDDSGIYHAIKHDELHFGREWDQSTSAARELVSGLLEKDPEKRYTLHQALEHAWVVGDAASDEKIDRSVVASLMAFNARNRFKKEALKLLASTFNASEVASLRASFLKIDRDNSGLITYAELTKALGEAGLHEKGRVDELLRSIDVDGDGSISYDEFITAVVDRQLIHRQNKVWWAFCEFDLDGDGKITVDELRTVLQAQDAFVALDAEGPAGGSADEREARARAYIAEYDLNGDGSIDYEEFFRMLLPKDVKYRKK
jgi:calcium-dependent protein kinase